MAGEQLVASYESFYWRYIIIIIIISTVCFSFGSVLSTGISFQQEITATPVVSFALQFTISQAGIAARILTLMQGSKEKKT